MTLLPNIFPMEIPLSPEHEAKRLTRNSGVEVPKATIVKPTTIGLTEKEDAIEDALSTSHSELKNNKIRPITNNKEFKIIFSPIN